MRSLDASVSALFLLPSLLRHSYGLLTLSRDPLALSSTVDFIPLQEFDFSFLYFFLPSFFSGFTCSLLCDDVFFFLLLISLLHIFFFAFFSVCLC